MHFETLCGLEDDFQIFINLTEKTNNQDALLNSFGAQTDLINSLSPDNDRHFTGFYFKTGYKTVRTF